MSAIPLRQTPQAGLSNSSAVKRNLKDGTVIELSLHITYNFADLGKLICQLNSAVISLLDALTTLLCGPNHTLQASESKCWSMQTLVVMFSPFRKTWVPGKLVSLPRQNEGIRATQGYKNSLSALHVRLADRDHVNYTCLQTRSYIIFLSLAVMWQCTGHVAWPKEFASHVAWPKHLQHFCHMNATKTFTCQ